MGPSDTADLSFIIDLDSYRDQFLAAMDDDFNTAGALAVLFDITRDVNTQIHSGEPISRGTLAGIDRLYCELGGEVLGLIPDVVGDDQRTADLASSLMQILIEMRESYRQNKEFDKADALRDRLAALGVVLEDHSGRTEWRLSQDGES
jgi:cysteinyl-tRNA synthetase